MSEKQGQPSSESLKHQEISNVEKDRRPKPEKTKEHQDLGEKFSIREIEQLGDEAEEQSKSQSDIKIGDEAHPEENVPFGANKELKKITYKRTMTHVRHQLSWPQKNLSKLTHQPVIDSLSRVSEKTIARPAGILAGGLIALIGSIIVLYTAKHYGFKYNLLLIFLLFVAGYIFGLVIELITRVLSKKR